MNRFHAFSAGLGCILAEASAPLMFTFRSGVCFSLFHFFLLGVGVDKYWQLNAGCGATSCGREG